MVFLYFIGWSGNGTPRSATFGFQLLLLSPLSAALTDIVAKSSFALSAADVDWLHGTSEVLLATACLYVASGFRNALAGEEERYGPSFRYPASAVVWLAVLATAYGPSVGFGEHSAFLLGLGNLGANPLGTLAVAAEPANALSIPTWTAHFASAFGWLCASGMVNRYGEYTGNPKWRLLAFAMLPLHASGVAGCTYHFFFNSPDVSFLVALQAGLALIGHTALLVTAVLLSVSNGWNVREAIESATLSNADRAYRERQLAQRQQSGLVPYDMQPTWLTIGGLGSLSVLASYMMKYATLATRAPFDPSEGVLTSWRIHVARSPARHAGTSAESSSTLSSVATACAIARMSAPAETTISSQSGRASAQSAEQPPTASQGMRSSMSCSSSERELVEVCSTSARPAPAAGAAPAAPAASSLIRLPAGAAAAAAAAAGGDGAAPLVLCLDSSYCRSSLEYCCRSE